MLKDSLTPVDLLFSKNLPTFQKCLVSLLEFFVIKRLMRASALKTPHHSQLVILL